MIEINSIYLRYTLQACNEGIDWFNTRFGHQSVPVREAIEALLNDRENLRDRSFDWSIWLIGKFLSSIQFANYCEQYRGYLLINHDCFLEPYIIKQVIIGFLGVPTKLMKIELINVGLQMLGIKPLDPYKFLPNYTANSIMK